MRLIVTSRQDIAGTNIYNELAGNAGFEKDGEFEGKAIYKKGGIWLIATKKNQTLANHLDAFFDPEYYVFASRHRSESGEKTLTVHTPGNLTDKAMIGGRPKELAFCNANAMKVALIELRKARDEMKLDYKVSLEATHHGPSELKKPVLFVEVGSSEEEWNDANAVKAVARAALKAAENDKIFEKAVGVGGNHYAPIHTKAMLDSKIAIGHIIPSYAINELEREVFIQAIEKTYASFGFLDWKGMRKGQRDKMLKFSSELNLELKRGRDLGRGVKYTYKEDSEIVAEAEKIARKRIEEVILKHEKLPKKDIREKVIEACVKIISEKYKIKLEEGRLIIIETKFDPEKAKKLGVVPGPLFGVLAKGKEIKWGNKIIKPEMVMKTEERVLYIKDRFSFDVISKALKENI
jgi:D-aminoacyl-tRNA deacylase